MFICSVIYVSDSTQGWKTHKIKHNYSDEHKAAAIIQIVRSYLIMICLYSNGLQLCLITSAVNCLSMCVFELHRGGGERMKLVKEVCLPFSCRGNKLKRRKTRPGEVARIRQLVPDGITVSLGSVPPVCPSGEP